MLREGELVGWLADDGTELTGTLERARWIGIVGQALSVVVTCNARHFVPCDRVWSVGAVQKARKEMTLVDVCLEAAVAAKDGVMTAGLALSGSGQDAENQEVAAAAVQ